METKKLYYDDAFLREFDATVLSCEAEKKNFAVVLSETAFYPEGGGQPADLGVLGGAKVLDVHEKDGVIVHTCDKPLTVGETVHGALDWARRFDHMQQHSGEHIVSGMLCSAYHCDNVGFHMGAEGVTIDFDGIIPADALAQIEQQANELIWQNLPIRSWYPPEEELPAIPYRSKKALDWPVRLVEIPGIDICACCPEMADDADCIHLNRGHRPVSGIFLSVAQADEPLAHSI